MPKECGHAKSFKDRCIECELVSAREGLAWAKDNLNQYSKLIEKLEAEKRLSDQVLLRR
jgi:hypothetical protein